MSKQLNAYALKSMLERTVAFLAEQQNSNGCWKDYQLITGESTSWVTAYTGLSLLYLLEAVEGDLLGSEIAFQIKALTEKAIGFLTDEKTIMLGGWGYNESLFPDTDSTALALQFLLKSGMTTDHPLITQGIKFLHATCQTDGGCCTYLNIHFPGPNYVSWTTSHLSVTAAAVGVWGNITEDREAERALRAAQEYIARHPTVNDLWHDYWWVGPYYPTGMIAATPSLHFIFDDTQWKSICLHLIERRHPKGGYGDINGEPDCFATAWTVYTLASMLNHDGLAKDMEFINEITGHIYDGVNFLLDRQHVDGGFSPGAYMRIPNPALPIDRHKPPSTSGRVSLDIQGVFTSATVLRSIAVIWIKAKWGIGNVEYNGSF